MSGKTPINRLEGGRLSFHLRKEERQKKEQEKTEQCGRNRMKWVVPLSFGRSQHPWVQLHFWWAKRAKGATSKHTKQRSDVSLSTVNSVSTQQVVSFFFYFWCVDHEAGWPNKGAAHYLRGNSPSLNKHKHRLSACSRLVFAFIRHICFKCLPL